MMANKMFKLDASQVKIAFQYMNIRLKLLKTALNIRYNKTCLGLQIVPSYVQIKITSKSYSAKKTKEIATKLWINNEIKQLHSKKNLLNTMLMKKHLELLQNLHASQVQNVTSVSYTHLDVYKRQYILLVTSASFFKHCTSFTLTLEFKRILWIL